jgi:ubiquinone/menaquinone biosynthesis C-methylase UbiE
MDKEYWDNYYKEHGLDEGIQEASSFAHFCQKNFLKYKEKTILEIGSGNGRDAKYFAKNKHNVIAIDQSHKGAELAKESHLLNVKFIEDDFIAMNYNTYKDIDVVYSRFTLHAIKEKECEVVINKVTNLLKKYGIFAVEVRSTNDPLCGVGENIGKNEWVTDHYRRFVESDIFIKTILANNFKILYFTERNDLSVYKDDNPVLIRVLFEKC